MLSKAESLTILPLRSIHFSAVETLSRSDRLVFHCENAALERLSATKGEGGGSPGRRGTILLGSLSSAHISASANCAELFSAGSATLP
jgi:hypothetical protein